MSEKTRPDADFGHTQFADPIREEYEKNFRPHITIGDEIPEERYQGSLRYLKVMVSKVMVSGIITNG